MTEEFIEEYTKCLESPAYFYNNYCVIKDKDGGVYKPVSVTDEQIEIARGVHETQRRLRQPFGSGMIPEVIKKHNEKHKTTCE